MITEVGLKQTEISEKLNGYSFEEVGDDHLFTGLHTPMKADAFKLSDHEKKERIALLFEEIMILEKKHSPYHLFSLYYHKVLPK